MLLLVTVLFGFMALVVGIGASHKLEAQREAHSQQLRKTTAKAKRIVSEYADDILNQGFEEGYRHAEATLKPKPHGKKRKAHA
ncbi:Uncharacterised protein [Mycobacteroides abscessus subsp. abscessus]|nr:Uncharacterised protein [Mycobacteroides abscessus subsp. abscessus]